MLVALQATGFGNTTGDLVSQKHWLDSAYLWVWNARTPRGVPIRWSFEDVDQAALPVVAGSQPATPDDLGQVAWILDQNGDPLREMAADEFDAAFGEDTVNGITGQPVAFKVVNRTITLGPKPGVTGTFTVSYRRRVAHYNGSSIVTAGTFTDDNDFPLWPDHHLILVHAAALIGHSGRSNPFSQLYQALRDEALQAMRSDLEAEAPIGRVWGEGGSRNALTLGR